jgi:hypothetical protein
MHHARIAAFNSFQGIEAGAMLRRFVAALFDQPLSNRDREARSLHNQKVCCTLAFLFLAAFPISSAGQQRTDADWDAEGQVAMSQYHDCTRAKHAFLQESAIAQASPIWLDEVARAAECSGDLTAALTYYNQELKRLPDTPRLVQKIGELRYQQELKTEQAQAGLVAAQAAAEKQRQQALRDAQDLAAARGRIGQDIQKLASLLERDFKIDWYFPNLDSTQHHHFKRHVTNIGHCELTFTTLDGKESWSQQLVFAGITAEPWDNEDVQVVGGAAVALQQGGRVITFNWDSQPWEAVRLINELHQACSP